MLSTDINKLDLNHSDPSKETEKPTPNTHAILLHQLEFDLWEMLEDLREYEESLNTYYNSFITPDVERGPIQHVKFAQKHNKNFLNVYEESSKLQENFLVLQKIVQDITAQPEEELRLQNLINTTEQINQSIYNLFDYRHRCLGLFLYYHGVVGKFLIRLQNELLKFRGNDDKEYLKSLQDIWHYVHSLKECADKFPPLNFQQVCFLLKILEKNLPDQETQIQAYIDLFFKSNQPAIQICGPIDLLYETIYLSSLYTLLYSSKVNSKPKAEITAIQQAFNTASKKLYQLIDNKADNTIFSQLYYTLTVKLPEISDATNRIIGLYNTNLGIKHKTINQNSELDAVNVLIKGVKQTLEQAFIYYKKSVVIYEEDHPIIVNNYRRTLLGCYNCFIECLVSYLKALQFILQKKDTMLNCQDYQNFHQIYKISKPILLLIERFKTESIYFRGTISENMTSLLKDIEKSHFPNTVSFYERDEPIVLYNPDISSKRNDNIYQSRVQVLHSINITCTKIADNIENIIQKITQSDQVGQSLLKEELVKKQQKKTPLPQQKLPHPNSSHKNNKQIESNIPKQQITKPPIQNKSRPKKENKPTAQGWSMYYKAAASINDNPMFAIGEYKNALTLATKHSDFFLIAICCQELAHIYYKIGTRQLKSANCKGLFVFNNIIPQNKEQIIADKDLDNFGYNFFDNFDQRNTQVTSLLTIYQNFNEALKYMTDATVAITSFKPIHAHERENIKEVKHGIKFSENIIKRAQYIVSNLNSLFYIIDTHHKYVKEILKKQRLNATNLEEYKKACKPIDPDVKNQKVIIRDTISTAINLYDRLLNTYSQADCREQVGHM